MSVRSSWQPDKVLLVGPSPPPHGGVAVHLANLRRHLEDRGIRCETFDPAFPGIAKRPALVQAALIARTVRRFSRRGWTIHAHTNGHNRRSWLLAMLTALAARGEGGRLLTLHSGMLPDYLGDAAQTWRGRLARLACGRFDRVIAVNDRIHRSLVDAGVQTDRMSVIPAWTGVDERPEELPAEVELWMAGRGPVLGSILSFRPEYRFGWQLAALVALRSEHPRAGLVVMGDGEQAAAARRRIREQGLEKDVLLLGDVPHDRCLAVLSRCDLSLRTTSHDGDALSVRESLALGVPVVASDVGFRPAGAHLFPADDFRGLVRQLRGVVSRRRSPASYPIDLTDLARVHRDEIARADLERLLGVYSALGTARLAPAASSGTVFAGNGLQRGGRR